MRMIVLALLQTTQGVPKSPLLVVFGLVMLVFGVIGLRTAVQKLRGDPRGWMGKNYAPRGPEDMFPRTIDIGGWLFGSLFLISGITLIVVYLAG